MMLVNMSQTLIMQNEDAATCTCNIFTLDVLKCTFYAEISVICYQTIIAKQLIFNHNLMFYNQSYNLIIVLISFKDYLGVGGLSETGSVMSDMPKWECEWWRSELLYMSIWCLTCILKRTLIFWCSSFVPLATITSTQDYFRFLRVLITSFFLITDRSCVTHVIQNEYSN